MQASLFAIPAKVSKIPGSDAMANMMQELYQMWQNQPNAPRVSI